MSRLAAWERYGARCRHNKAVRDFGMWVCSLPGFGRPDDLSKEILSAWGDAHDASWALYLREASAADAVDRHAEGANALDDVPGRPAGA